MNRWKVRSPFTTCARGRARLGVVAATAVMAVAVAVAAAAETGLIVEHTVPTANSQPISIVAGPDGNLWFTEFRGNKIARMTTDAVFTEFPIPTTNSQPDDMDVGPDGTSGSPRCSATGSAASRRPV
jgi:hypothetical protein